MFLECKRENGVIRQISYDVVLAERWICLGGSRSGTTASWILIFSYRGMGILKISIFYNFI